MPVTVIKPELDLNLRFLPEAFEELLAGLSFAQAQAIREYFEEIRYLFTKIEPDVRRVAVSAENSISFPYQTLTTSATNLTSGEMHGRTRTQSVLTTNSKSTVQFDWRKSKRKSKVVVGPGDGVEPHAFMVNHFYNVAALRWEYVGGAITLRQRNGLVMPYADGTSRQLIFFEFDKTDGLPKPVDLAYGTTIYLEQRLSGDE